MKYSNLTLLRPAGALRVVAVGLLAAGLAASPALAQRGGGGHGGGGGYGRGGGGYGGGYRGGYGGGYGYRGGWGGGWGVGLGWGGYGWGGYPYWGYGYPGYYYAPYPAAYPYAAAPPPQAAPVASAVPYPLPHDFDLSVVFATGSADLTPEATQTLDQLGQALTSNQVASDRFRIEGHTDTVGRPDANMVLSQQRADAVVSYLEAKFNIPSSRLEAIGVGENDLAVQTPDQTPELRNRRVHVVNLST